MATNDGNPRPRRLFLTDRKSKTRYLIDTGSDVSVYPRSQCGGIHRREKYELGKWINYRNFWKPQSPA